MRLRLSILMMLGLTLGLPAADPLWQRYVSLNHDIRAKRQQISQLDQVITGLGVAIVTPELTRLRAAVTEAQLAVTAATSTGAFVQIAQETTAIHTCLLYTSPSPRDRQKSRMPSSA